MTQNILLDMDTASFPPGSIWAMHKKESIWIIVNYVLMQVFASIVLSQPLAYAGIDWKLISWKAA